MSKGRNLSQDQVLVQFVSVTKLEKIQFLYLEELVTTISSIMMFGHLKKVYGLRLFIKMIILKKFLKKEVAIKLACTKIDIS